MGSSPGGLPADHPILHFINGLLVYLLLHRLAAERWGALAGALFFLLHPVQVESVAWMSQRKNLLALLFFLAAFLLYTHFRDSRPIRSYPYMPLH